MRGSKGGREGRGEGGGGEGGREGGEGGREGGESEWERVRVHINIILPMTYSYPLNTAQVYTHT